MSMRQIEFLILCHIENTFHGRTNVGTHVTEVGPYVAHGTCRPGKMSEHAPTKMSEHSPERIPTFMVADVSDDNQI